MVGLSNIISVGGAGGSGGGGGSGIQEINGQTGPIVTFIGVNGIVVTVPSSNTILIDASSISGLVPTQSGVIGVNGIDVQQVDGNFVVDGAALSGTVGTGNNCFSSSFTATTSGRFTHNLGTRDVVVSVSDDSLPPASIIPDRILFDTPNVLSVLFNAPQTGNITVVSCGGSSSVSGVTKFSAPFTNVSSFIANHNLATEDVLVQVRDDSSPPQIMIPDGLVITNSNSVTVNFNSNRSGRITVMG